MGDPDENLARLLDVSWRVNDNLHKKSGYVVYCGDLDEAEELSAALNALDPQRRFARYSVHLNQT